MNQKDFILRYLKTGKKLTPLKALELFGCMSLSQRCGELKKQGYEIRSKLIELPTGKRVGLYWLD
jgi:hypothetical protein